jgi:hypothetical protein
MGINFPNAPTTNQLYPQPPVAGLPVYRWDGQKWTTQGAPATRTPVYTDGSTPMTAQLTLVAPPVNSTDAAAKSYVDGNVSSALHDVGRNLLHNSLFNIQQRGAGPWTTNAYTADRWILNVNTDAISATIVSAVDGVRTQIGDEAVQFFFQNTFTGSAAATAATEIIQNIERVRRLAGKTVTVSFYAVASTAGLKLGLNVFQYFGSGGSPSAGVYAQATGSVVTLSATWARYSVTIAIPSAVGKTLGTNNDDFTQLILYLSSGANNNATAGNIGVQSGTVQLWGMQLEIGSVATPLEKPDPQQDLAKCQRFYQTSIALLQVYSTAGANFDYGISFATPMRAAPTIAFVSISYSSASGLTAGNISNAGFNAFANATATGTVLFSSSFTASADL